METFAWYCSNKLFTQNPIKSKIHSIKLKETDVKNTAYLSHQDWAKLEDRIYRPKDRLIIHLLYYGGLRLSELSNLKLTCFDEDNQTIRFERKGGYKHTLRPQKSHTIFEILSYIQKDIHDYIFTNKQGKALSTRTLYNKIIRNINISKRISYNNNMRKIKKI